MTFELKLKEGINITGSGAAREKALRLRRIGPITEKARGQGTKITASERKKEPRPRQSW